MHSTRKRYTWITWLPLIGMVISAFVITAPLAYWIRMWGLAFVLYFGFKWAVLYEWSGESGRISRYDWIRFFFFWPGMEIEEFLGAKGKAIHAKPGE
ncbi:hypothetical protein N9C83_05405 [Opitutales bacterium]|nr:hypothetical protein [Opitutales bacterium]